jgi:hypothetical protein
MPVIPAALVEIRRVRPAEAGFESRTIKVRQIFSNSSQRSRPAMNLDIKNLVAQARGFGRGRGCWHRGDHDPIISRPACPVQRLGLMSMTKN